MIQFLNKKKINKPIIIIANIILNINQYDIDVAVAIVGVIVGVIVGAIVGVAGDAGQALEAVTGNHWETTGHG